MAIYDGVETMKLIRDLVTSKNSIVFYTVLREAKSSPKVASQNLYSKLALVKDTLKIPSTKVHFCWNFLPTMKDWCFLSSTFLSLSIPAKMCTFRRMSETCFANCALGKENTKLRRDSFGAVNRFGESRYRSRTMIFTQEPRLSW